MNVSRIVADFLLMATACVVILLNVVVGKTPQQTLLHASTASAVETFSVPVGDPFIDELRERWWEFHHPTPSEPLSLARWQFELADFYLSTVSNESDETKANVVAQVTHVAADQRDPATANYWAGERAAAQRVITREQSRQEQARLASKPAYRLGPLLPPRHSLKAWAGSVAIGFVGGLAYVLWLMAVPPVACMSIGIRASSLVGVDSASSEFSFDADSTWAQMKQPARVVLRRSVAVVAVATALATTCITLC